MKKFAVFDIDGTLIRWQLYHVIVDRLAKAGEISQESHEKLREARLSWKNREHDESFTKYEMVLIEIFESSITSISPKIFDQLVDEVISEYRNQVYTFTRDLISDLKQKDYMLLAISGSHNELVAEISKFYDFDDWVGTNYEREEDGYSGKSFIASHHKATILNDLIKKHDLDIKGSYGVGDSRSDAPMLNMVENPIAFNPDKKLFQIAQEKHWRVVLERKNMVYQLQWENGHYLLAETSR